MIMSAHNEVECPDTRIKFTKKYRGLRRKDDTRDECVLFTGNGISLGLLSELSLRSQFPCGINDLLCFNENVQYLPFRDDRFNLRPLWDDNLWPKLTSYTESNKSDDIWRLISQNSNLNFTRPLGTWSIDEASLMFELRWYLWFYFRNSFKVYKQVLSMADRWSWLIPLIYLLDNYKFSYITLNYDLFFDLVLNQYLNQPIHFVHNLELEPLDLLPANFIPMVKLHGSINSLIPRYSLLGGNYTNPWLANDFEHYNNKIKNLPLEIMPNFGVCEVDPWPWLPELVPPGRPGDDLVHPLNNTNAYSEELLTKCKYLIVCGASAAEPDTTEISRLMSNVSQETTIIHILYKSQDEYPPMRNILKGIGGNYIDIEPTELSRITEIMR